jgi:uncharacterized protein (UPF0332 family)
LRNEAEVRDYLVKAREEVTTSKDLLDLSHVAASLSRAYYAMYYVTEALLLSIDKSYSTHKGTINGFAEYFVKTGEFAPHFRKRLAQAFDLRMEADYDPTPDVDAAAAREVLSWAEEFLSAAGEYLKKG